MLGVLLAGYVIGAGGWIFFVGISAVNILSIYELHEAFKKLNVHIAFNICSFFSFLLLYTASFMQDVFFIFVPFCIALMIIFIFLYSIINNNRNDFTDVVFTVFTFVYTSVLFTYFILTRSLPLGKQLVWWIFIITWACDIGAFLAGTMFGKKKITPTISPHKTLEGSIGGLLISVIISVIFAKMFLAEVSVLNALILGIIIGICSQLGDISASLIKRCCGIKDFSNIIPGHGGILDRFDSALFSFPAAYYYIAIILNKGGFL